MNVPNKKTVNLFLRRSKTYNILIEGFSKTSLWFVTLSNAISASFSLSVLGIVTSKLSHKILLGIDALRQNMYASISVSPKTSLEYILRLVYKITFSLSNGVSLNYILRIISRITNTLSPKISLDFSILVANFNLLSEYDGDTLSSMDGETLNSLDYTIA